MKTSTLVAALLPPVVAVAWFAISLDSRIDSGWVFDPYPKQSEFTAFKWGIAILLAMPAFVLTIEDDHPHLSMAGGIVTGTFLLKEAVGLWMIVLTRVITVQTPLAESGFQFAVSAFITFLGFGLAYGLPVVSWIRRRRVPADVS